MRENITSQTVLFEGGFVKPVVAAFDQPASSSDGGALLLKLADDRLRLTAAVAGALPDAREAGKVRHSLLAVVQQRAFGIGNGYEDANDAARLRDDPTHQLLLGRCPGAGSELASQPTISRLENAFDEKHVAAASEAFSGAVLNRHQRRLRRNAKRIIIDVDATWDDAHGEQQGALFNGLYGNHGFLPLLAFIQFDDEAEQYLVASLLRPGNAGNDQVLSFLSGVIENVRAHFPRAQVTLRADAGFAIPSVFEYLDDHRVRYAIGMSSNSVLKEHAEPGMAIARALSEASGTSERVYVDKQYETKRSWPHSRRMIIKAEVTRYPGRIPRDNARFVVTDLVGDAAFVYESVYSRRGDVENLRQGTQERHPHGQDELHELRGEPAASNLARHGVRPIPGDPLSGDRHDLRQRTSDHHQGAAHQVGRLVQDQHQENRDPPAPSSAMAQRMGDHRKAVSRAARLRQGHNNKPRIR